jgi:hypothetical protein
MPGLGQAMVNVVLGAALKLLTETEGKLAAGLAVV